MTSVADRLMKGTVWLAVARAIVNALAVLSTIVLARLLAPADFGLVAVATTLMLIMTEVTGLSLSQALVRHEAPGRAHFDTAWTLNALRGLLLGGVLAAAGPLVAKIYGDARLTPIMLAIGASVLLSGLGNPRRVMLQRDLIFWQEFVLSVAQKLAGVAASVAVAWYFGSYWALVVGVLVTQLTNVIVSYTVLPFRPRPTFAHARELLSFSLWVTAVQIVNTLNWRFDHLFVGKLLGPAALGHYTVGSNLAAMPTRESTGPLKQTFFPGFVSVSGDRARLAAAYQRAQAFVTAVALPAGIGMALIADPLVRLTLGEQWLPVIFIMQSLAAVFAFQTLGSLVDPLGMAKGETRTLLVRSLQMLLVRIPIIVAGMWFFGMVGVILARVFTGLLSTWVNMALVRRLTGVGVGEQLRVNLRAFGAAAVMAGGVLVALRFVEHGHTPAALVAEIAGVVLLAALLYGGSTWLLWVFAGRPTGPEHDMKHFAGKLLRKLKR